MSYHVVPPQVVTFHHSTCGFHEKHPGRSFPGCTCSSGISSRDKRLDEMTDAERSAYVAALGGEKPDSTPIW